MAAITLTAAIDAFQTVIPVSGDLPAPWSGDQNRVKTLVQIDGEYMTVEMSGSTSWLVTRSVEGTFAVAHLSGATIVPVVRVPGPYPLLGPAGILAETMRREECPEVNTVVATTGHVALQAIWLRAGTIVSNITFVSATTAAGTPTAYAFGLVSGGAAGAPAAGTTLASSADQTNTAWAANTAKTLAMTTPYVVPASGVYYLAFACTATTVPTLKGGTAKTDGTLAGLTPPLSGVSGTAYTSGALPATVAIMAAGAVTTSFYGAVS